MKYLVDDNQLLITFRTVFEELISEQTQLSVAVRVRERISSDSSPEILFSERNADRTRESSGQEMESKFRIFENKLTLTSGRMRASNPDRDHPHPLLPDCETVTFPPDQDSLL